MRGPASTRSDLPAARTFAATLVLAAATSLQLGAAFATTLFAELGPAGTVLLRLVFAALLLMALWRPRLLAEPGRSRMLVIVFGLVVAGLNLSFYSAIDRAPLGIVMTISFAGPLGVAVASSRRVTDGLWVLLAAVGIVSLSWGGGDGSLDTAGLLLAMANAGFWASYILIAARVGEAFTGGRGLALGLVFAAVVALPLGLASGGSALLRPELLAGGLLVAILSSAIPYSCEMEAIRRLPAGTIGVLMSFQPAVAAIVGFFVLGQGLSAREVVAIALVVVASMGALSRRPTPEPIEAGL